MTFSFIDLENENAAAAASKEEDGEQRSVSSSSELSSDTERQIKEYREHEAAKTETVQTDEANVEEDRVDTGQEADSDATASEAVEKADVSTSSSKNLLEPLPPIPTEVEASSRPPVDARAVATAMLLKAPAPTMSAASSPGAPSRLGMQYLEPGDKGR